MKRLALLAVLGSLGLLAGCGGDPENCATQAGGPDDINRIVTTEDPNGHDDIVIVCENGRIIKGP